VSTKEEKDPLQPGKETGFVYAWGSLMAAYAQQRNVLLILAFVTIVSILGNVALGIGYTHRETWVFVKDNLGQVVQADPNTFLRAGADRDQNEVKGFALRWCRDAMEFTPLDVQDKITYALRYVDQKAQGAIKDQFRMAERAQLVEKGMSLKIDDDIASGKVPQVTIIRNDPCEVLVVVSRYGIAPDGAKTPLPPLAIRVILKMVPRSPQNPNGLVVTDMTATNS